MPTDRRPSSEEELKILMVAPQPFFRVRGTPFSILHRIRALVELGHQVDLVTYPFGEDPNLDGLTIHRAARPPWVEDVAIGPSLPKLLLDVPVFVKAMKLAGRNDYDIIHTHEEGGAMGAWIARRFRIPHLYDMHSSLPQQFENFGRFNWRPVISAFRAIESYTLRGADGVLAICGELGDQVHAAGYGGPVQVIENTLDLTPPHYDESDEMELRAELGLESKAEVVLYTGTFEPYQGLPLLVRSVPKVVDQKPNTIFVLVGGEPDEISELRRVAAEHGSRENVVLVPKVAPERVFLFHRIADVLITTRTRGTNTPLKIYQYLRAGVPIVATNIYSHTQVLTDESAELVEPRPADIARGILDLLTDEARAERLARNADRLARRNYSKEAYMEKLSSLLDDVVSGSRSPAAV